MYYLLSQLLLPTLSTLIFLLFIYQGLGGIYAIFYWLIPVKFLNTPDTSMNKINNLLQTMFSPLVMPLHNLLSKYIKNEKIQMGTAILVVFLILTVIRTILSYYSTRLMISAVMGTITGAIA